MSYKWPDKDKDENNIEYSVDWSRLLKDDLITSTAWFIKDADGIKTPSNDQTGLADAAIVNGLQFVTKTLSDSSLVATVHLSLGTNNTRYTIICSVTTASNKVYERSIFLRIKEK